MNPVWTLQCAVDTWYLRSTIYPYLALAIDSRPSKGGMNIFYCCKNARCLRFTSLKSFWSNCASLVVIRRVSNIRIWLMMTRLIVPWIVTGTYHVPSFGFEVKGRPINELRVSFRYTSTGRLAFADLPSISSPTFVPILHHQISRTFTGGWLVRVCSFGLSENHVVKSLEQDIAGSIAFLTDEYCCTSK